MAASCLLLAIQSILQSGKVSLQGGDAYSKYYSISSLEKFTYDRDSMDAVLDLLIEEAENLIGEKLGDQKEAVLANLETIKELELYDDGEQTQCIVNNIFSKKVAKFYTFMYAFNPSQNKDEFDVEQLSSYIDARLGDKIIILYNSKKTLFGKRSWQELKYIPATINEKTVTNALKISLAPFILRKSPAPSKIVDYLITNAKQNTEVVTSDDERRQVYDPLTKMMKVETNPAVLKLIPTKWLACSGEFEVEKANSDWEFTY